MPGASAFTVGAIRQQGVSAPIITGALLRRIRSRDQVEYADRLLAARRHEFGGHEFRLEAPQ